MYRKAIFIGFLAAMSIGPAFCDTSDLMLQITKTRTACSGISNDMADLKKMAGINTAVTAVGTVAGGVALGTGLAKVGVDAEAEQIEAELQEEIRKLNELAASQNKIDSVPDFDPTPSASVAISTTNTPSTIEQKQAELDELTKKSKTLGNIRTGTLAGATVADTAGAIIAANNKVDKDLETRIEECKAAVEELQKAIMPAKMDGEDVSKAQQIVNACREYNYIDLSPINKRAKGAMVSAIVGATSGLAGTVTSAMANTDATRNDNTDAGKQKEKNLNTASNVLAGTTTIASGVATVFNATQISAIKKVAKVADECEGALNQ